MESIELEEQCIKFCEKISLDTPREILRSGVLVMAVNFMDFFDKNMQVRILQLI